MSSEVQTEADKASRRPSASAALSRTAAFTTVLVERRPAPSDDASACLKLPPSQRVVHVSPWEMLSEESLCCVFQLEEEDPDRGQPCMHCGDQCPGFHVHGWRYKHPCLLIRKYLSVFNDELRCTGQLD